MTATMTNPHSNPAPHSNPSNSPTIVNPTHALTPRPYQEEAITFFRANKRIMCNDKPGLGKTLQAVEAASCPVLISAPTQLAEQWYDFLQVQRPNDTVCLIRGTRPVRKALLKRKYDWYIINHDMLRSYTLPSHIKTFIMDESHHLRRPTAARSRAAANYANALDDDGRPLPTRDPIEYVFELTATPIWKEPDDLFQQLHILNPRLYPDYYYFCRKYLWESFTPYGAATLKFRPYGKQTLNEELANTRIERTYRDVGRQLPRLVENVMEVTMPTELMNMYKTLKNQWRLADLPQSTHMAVMHLLRRMASWPGKLEALETLTEMFHDGEPYVVFTYYVHSAKQIAERLNIPIITGDTPAALRPAIAHSGTPVVATIPVLTEGVNLQHMRHVIFYEEDWPPGSNTQAIARVRRDGGHPTTFVHYLHSRNTIDQYIHETSKSRYGTIKSILKDALE